LVRAFIPQGRNSSIEANTNFPPQGKEAAGGPPPESFNLIDDLGNDFVDDLGNNIVQSGP